MPQFPFPQITNPVTLRARAALAGAGAWDAAPLEIACPQHTRMTLFIEYVRGAAGGAVDFQWFVSPYSANVAGVEDWFAQSEFTPAVLVPGLDSQSRMQREYITYLSQAAAAETFVLGPIELGAGVERIYIRARESGIVATPGICHIVGIIYDEQ
jgi:hypothetical protein